MAQRVQLSGAIYSRPRERGKHSGALWRAARDTDALLQRPGDRAIGCANGRSVHELVAASGQTYRSSIRRRLASLSSGMAGRGRHQKARVESVIASAFGEEPARRLGRF